MTHEAGIVCGECDRLNPLKSDECEDCGQPLSLHSEAGTKIDLEEDSVPPLALDPPTDEETPPPADQKGAEEKPMEQAHHYICKSCYSPVPSGHKFCGKCGTPSEAKAEDQDANFFGDMQTPGKAKLILIRGEGMDGISYHLNSIEHAAGRMEGAILFTEDKWLSPKHANFYYANNALVVSDEDSENGVFICIKESVDVTPGSTIMAGEQFFRVEEVSEIDDAPDEDETYYFASPRRDATFRLVQILEGGGEGMIVHARDNQVVVGREGCDMNFPNDPYISGTHLKLEAANGVITLEDLDSKNGTYIRIVDEQPLNHGDYLFLGRQLLRVEITN